MDQHLPIKALFSGGPKNGERAMVIDAYEIYFAVMPELKWYDPSESDITAPILIKKALYRRTKDWDLDNKIFEFVGTE